MVRTYHGIVLGSQGVNYLTYVHYKLSYIMANARLDESQAGIKIAERNINNLRYTDDIALVAESKEEPKSLLMKVKDRVKKLA